jgi:lipopolysaccharide/colanic/teichoic acid biosynthesis glycosyltransferase
LATVESDITAKRQGLWPLPVRRPNASAEQTQSPASTVTDALHRRAGKRGVDLVVAGLLLILLAPLLVVIAIAIRLTSGGPVLYRQTRIGWRGEAFSMLKFRTMCEDAHNLRASLEHLNESSGTFKLRNDPRLTRVGCWLRRTSLDELPQLINVLRGQMSLVGPRPLIAEEDRRIEGAFRERLRVRPGMTGRWQTLGPVRPPLREMVVIDCLYVEQWSLWEDLKILGRTLVHMVRLRGV